jgi:hypothetical protein
MLLRYKKFAYDFGEKESLEDCQFNERVWVRWKGNNETYLGEIGCAVV